VSQAVTVAALTLVAVLLIMAGEAVLSAVNERVLRARGALAPAHDVLRPMLLAYPACFVAVAIEGSLSGPASRNVLAIGLLVFGLSKALKLWSITALGVRWTFRVLVIPHAPLVTHGPYALMRHPNYLAVLGEIAGVALIVSAPFAGTLSVLGYGALLLRKIAVEDRALGRQ
jgi:methyltransferase